MPRSPARIWVDASTVIALARVGALDLLPRLASPVHVTPVVRNEIMRPGLPERSALEHAWKEGHIVEVPFEGDPASLRIYGLDAGEASLFLAATPNDLLVLDDGSARRLAELGGRQRTGLLGLIVAAVRHGRLDPERAQDLLGRLAQSDFRMSAALLDWARDAVRNHAPSGSAPAMDRDRIRDRDRV